MTHHLKIQQSSLITALKTPFNTSGEVDLSAYDYLVDRQIAAGVEGVIVGGTTGEGHLLDWETHLMLIAHTAEKYGEQLCVIGNTGSNNTREAIKATQYGFASGMDATLQINPYYGKTTEEGVYRHLSLQLEIGPSIIYNVAARTGQDISPEIIQRLAQHENFIGVKECSGNARIASYVSQGIHCWSGNDDECFDARHREQCGGVISVTSNIVPGLMRRLMDEDFKDLNLQLKPLFNWLFTEPNPIGINTMLAMTGAVQPVFRLPYLPLSLSQRELGREILSRFEIKDRVGEKLQTLADKDFNVLV